VAMLAKNFRRLMRDDQFKKKFSEKVKKAPREAKHEEEEKKDPRGPRCYECSSFGHIRAECGNLKKGKGKAYNVTLSDESEEEASESEKLLAFAAPLVEEEENWKINVMAIISLLCPFLVSVEKKLKKEKKK
jgi:hypothetical protein